MSVLNVANLQRMFVPYTLEVGRAPTLAHDHSAPAFEAKIMLLFNATHAGLTPLAKPLKIMSVTSDMLTAPLSGLFPESPCASPMSSSPASPVPSFTLAGAFKDLRQNLEHGHTKPKDCRACEKCRALAEVTFTLQQGFSALAQKASTENRRVFELASTVGEACVRKYTGFFGSLASLERRPGSAPASTDGSNPGRLEKRRRFSSSVVPVASSSLSANGLSALPEGLVTMSRSSVSHLRAIKPVAMGHDKVDSDGEQLFPIPEPTTPERKPNIVLQPKTPIKPQALNFSTDDGSREQRVGTHYG